MALPVSHETAFDPLSDSCLTINAPLVAGWLVSFLQDEVIRRRGIRKAVLGLSGGVDSAVVAYLCARAFGPENVHVFRMPYKISSQESLDHAQLVVDDLGIQDRTIEITGMVDGYISAEQEISPARLGNVCARSRMISMPYRLERGTRASGFLATTPGMRTIRLPSTRWAICSRLRFGN